MNATSLHDHTKVSADTIAAIAEALTESDRRWPGLPVTRHQDGDVLTLKVIVGECESWCFYTDDPESGWLHSDEDTRPDWASEKIECDPIGFAIYSEEFPTLRLAQWVEPQPDLLVEINDCHEFPPAQARRFAAEIIRLADIAEGKQREVAPLASTPVAVLCVASGHQYIRLQLLDQTVMLNVATAVDLVDAIASELAFCSPGIAD